MKLATLRNGERDGALVVVRRDNERYALATHIAPSLQAALDTWDAVESSLQTLARELESGAVAGEPLDISWLDAPLPRAYEWVDGSAYLNHVRLVRQARNAEPPKTLETDPLVYQGGSGVLLGPTDPLVLPEEGVGLDFEAELVAILGDTPRGVSADDAQPYVRLLMLCNDVTLRDLIPGELAKGFGFFQSKPATAFSPFAVTPDELGSAFSGGRLHLSMVTRLNGEVVGDVHTGPEMHFSFYDLLAHITRTRAFTAGTLLGSGTISNTDARRGISCLSERRMREIIAEGEPKTGYLQQGDRVQIDVHDGRGNNVFGTIDQTVAAA